MEDVPLVRMEGIVKKFPGVRALDGVDFELRAGEIHVLVGQNGAGKSTLVNILAGTISQDQGTISVEGKTVSLGSPAAAQNEGIAIVPQEIPVFSDLNVAENLFMGMLPTVDQVKLLSIIDYRYLHQAAEDALKKLKVEFKSTDLAGALPIASQQLLTIGKALVRNAKVLIMDEPTASLGNREVDILFDILSELCEREKVGIIYICHRLDEAKRVGHRITVIRDGRKVGTVGAKAVSTDQLFEMMTGHETPEKAHHHRVRIGEPVIVVEGLCSGQSLSDVCFEVGEGEVVGVAGVVGSGRSELLRMLFGEVAKSSGRIEILGKSYDPKNCIDAIRHGLGYLPADRNLEGLHLLQNVAFNISLASLSQLTSKLGIVSNERERVHVTPLMERLGIKAASIETLTLTLSGGNRQKVSIAKWISAGSRIILCDEPTRGVDVGAKMEIYQLIREMSTKGTTFLISSPDVEELITVCDRVLVMRRGRIISDLLNSEVSEERILDLVLSESSTGEVAGSV